MSLKRRIAAVLTSLAIAVVVMLTGSQQASAATVYTGATRMPAMTCYFDSNHWTHVQVTLYTYSKDGIAGYYHRIGANYMGTYAKRADGTRFGNAESITDWQVRQQNESGSVNFGVGNDYWFSPPALGSYDESTTSAEYNYVHGSGLYVWMWLRRDDGKTCWIKSQLT